MDNIVSLVNYKQIGEDIRAERENQNLSREELAEISQVHWRTIQNIEYGKRIKDDNILKICTALGKKIQSRHNLIDI